MGSVKEHSGQSDWLTVADAVAEMSGTICEEKVRRWCRTKKIEGVMNIADGVRNAHYRIPRAGWEKFLASRRQGGLLPPLPTARRLLGRAGTNHLGI